MRDTVCRDTGGYAQGVSIYRLSYTLNRLAYIHMRTETPSDDIRLMTSNNIFSVSIFYGMNLAYLL